MNYIEIAFNVLVIAAVATGCSSTTTSHKTQAGPAPKAVASAVEPTATPRLDTPTPSPIPSPFPVPTPSPVPTPPERPPPTPFPLFRPVALPSDPADESTAGMFDAAVPPGAVPWLDVDFEYRRIREFALSHPEHQRSIVHDLHDSVLFESIDEFGRGVLLPLDQQPPEIAVADLFPMDETSRAPLIFTAPAVSRNVVAAGVRIEARQTVELAFVDLSQPGPIRTETIPDSSKLYPAAVCPELSSGETAVILVDFDTLGSVVEVWSDTPEARLGSSRFTNEPTPTRTRVNGCLVIDDDLVAFGSSCSRDSADAASFTRDCGAQLVVSDTGHTWTEHPKRHRLLEAEETSLQAAVRVGPGIILSATSSQSTSSLWLATRSALFQIPAPELSQLDSTGFLDVAFSNGQLIVSSGSEIFVADLDQVVRRTLRSEAELAAWQRAANAPTPTFDPFADERFGTSDPTSTDHLGDEIAEFSVTAAAEAIEPVD